MRVSLNYRFLLRLGIALALLDTALCGAAAWLVFQNAIVIPLWGPESLAAFLFYNGALTGFLFGFVVTKYTQNALRTHQVLPLHWHHKSQTMIDKMPSGTFHRSFILGLCGVLFAFLTLVLLELQNRQALLFSELIILSSIQAALCGAGITAMAFYRALGDKFSTTKPVSPQLQRDV